MEEECSYDHNINQPGAKIKPDKKKMRRRREVGGISILKKVKVTRVVFVFNIF